MKKIASHALVFLLSGFLLGAWNGRLAVWKDEDPQPVHVFDCRISSLPPADQILLRRGIPAANSQELAALIEDFL